MEMEKKTKFNIGFVIIAIWGILLIQGVLSSYYQATVIPYSEFQENLKKGTIESITITTNKQVYGWWEYVYITARVTDGTNPVRGAVLRLPANLTPPSSPPRRRGSGRRSRPAPPP